MGNLNAKMSSDSTNRETIIDTRGEGIMTENQIDHVAINKTWRSSLQTRVKRSANAGSGHHLVVAEIKIKLLTLNKARSAKSKYCNYKLKEQRVKDEFVIALANRYDALDNKSDGQEETKPDLEQEWSQIKEMNSSTCAEILGKVRKLVEETQVESQDAGRKDKKSNVGLGMSL